MAVGGTRLSSKVDRAPFSGRIKRWGLGLHQISCGRATEEHGIQLHNTII